MEQRNGGRPLNVGTVATSSLPLPIHPSIHPTIHPSASLPSPLVPLYIDGRAPRLPLRAATPANLTTTSSQVICPEINFPFGYCGPRKRYYVTNYSSYRDWLHLPAGEYKYWPTLMSTVTRGPGWLLAPTTTQGFQAVISAVDPPRLADDSRLTRRKISFTPNPAAPALSALFMKE